MITLSVVLGLVAAFCSFLFGWRSGYNEAMRKVMVAIDHYERELLTRFATAGNTKEVKS